MPATVLVVEDYADLRTIVVSALAQENYVCDSVVNDDALAQLETHDYKTILLSPTFPIDDDPVIRYLVAHGEGAKVILMTDPSEEPSADYRMLEKPFNRDELFAKLRAKS